LETTGSTEENMKVTIAILATLLVTTGALAQKAGAYYGPFTDAEAQLLSAVWPEIREAEDYESINWPAHGLARAPGNRDVQRLMAARWDEIRHAARFEQIDWDELTQDRPQTQQGAYDAGPFTREEAAVMSQFWPQIREAAEFDDVNWRSIGLSGAPGSREARRIMADNWGDLRESARFEDIDWRSTIDYRERYGYRTR
jgi:hypothetical protein